MAFAVLTCNIQDSSKFTSFIKKNYKYYQTYDAEDLDPAPCRLATPQHKE